jgi:hypothetical protein
MLFLVSRPGDGDKESGSLRVMMESEQWGILLAIPRRDKFSCEDGEEGRRREGAGQNPSSMACPETSSVTTSGNRKRMNGSFLEEDSSYEIL